VHVVTYAENCRGDAIRRRSKLGGSPELPIRESLTQETFARMRQEDVIVAVLIAESNQYPAI
jgi:hypothetical protein